jgi:predicted DNA-binding transcriptional regulator YafY
MDAALQNDFLTIIDSAITHHRVVQIKHNNTWRTIEPYIAGIYKGTQQTSLYGFCRDVIPTLQSGPSNRWQFFNLDDIEDIEVTLYEFRPHSDYRGTHEQIQPVYLKLNS